MAIWAKSTLAGTELAIEAFGRRLRQGRHRASLTQMRLEELSGVDQSLISKLELARAPHVSLERVVRLGQALGNNFPLGYCPHEHRCPFRPDWQAPPWEGNLPYQQRRLAEGPQPKPVEVSALQPSLAPDATGPPPDLSDLPLPEDPIARWIDIRMSDLVSRR